MLSNDGFNGLHHEMRHLDPKVSFQDGLRISGLPEVDYQLTVQHSERVLSFLESSLPHSLRFSAFVLKTCVLSGFDNQVPVRWVFVLEYKANPTVKFQH